ncbi:MAG: hypothetical protein R3281_14775, partial [Balneolaceae bacterium]|nr:hypothetical protein [Balneolaceae bacterium]
IGMACSLLILLWINDELAYDRFHRDIGRIYRVMENQQYAQGNIFTTSSTPGPLALGYRNPGGLWSDGSAITHAGLKFPGGYSRRPGA